MVGYTLTSVGEMAKYSSNISKLNPIIHIKSGLSTYSLKYLKIESIVQYVVVTCSSKLAHIEMGVN